MVLKSIQYLILFLGMMPSIALANPDWEAVDKRSETTYKISNYTLLGGIVVSLTGSFSDQRSLQTGGELTTAVSIATMAGSSLRQRRSIVERGVTLSPAWGYSSWGLQAASAGLLTAYTVYTDKHKLTQKDNQKDMEKHIGPVVGLGIGSLACSIGAILTASKQHKENAFKRSMIGRSESRESSQRLLVSVAPYVSVDGSAGIGASALF